MPVEHWLVRLLRNGITERLDDVDAVRTSDLRSWRTAVPGRTLRHPRSRTVDMGKSHLGETCETCGTTVRKIMWGMPIEADARQAERKGWYIGGCCIDERVSRCECGATAYDADGHPVGDYPLDDVDLDGIVSPELARSKQSHPSSHHRRQPD
jgi:hypothetical protein